MNTEFSRLNRGVPEPTYCGSVPSFMAHFIGNRKSPLHLKIIIFITGHPLLSRGLQGPYKIHVPMKPVQLLFEISPDIIFFGIIVFNITLIKVWVWWKMNMYSIKFNQFSNIFHLVNFAIDPILELNYFQYWGFVYWIHNFSGYKLFIVPRSHWKQSVILSCWCFLSVCTIEHINFPFNKSRPNPK